MLQGVHYIAVLFKRRDMQMKGRGNMTETEAGRHTHTHTYSLSLSHTHTHNLKEEYLRSFLFYTFDKYTLSRDIQMKGRGNMTKTEAGRHTHTRTHKYEK